MKPYDVAVVIPTIGRPVLERAVQSVFRQDFPGTIQILIGVGNPIGDRELLSKLDHLGRLPTATSSCLTQATRLPPGMGSSFPQTRTASLRTSLSYAALIDSLRIWMRTLRGLRTIYVL